ncbi:MAG TPA: hypothetical protein ENJ29_15605 [Bacteroidetes bacterium]|nr:hypothetical protein [Bacteroidota bacterium]
MGESRTMIRLIDVALIILMGFIAISRLKTEYVHLPMVGDAKAPKKKIHTARLAVHNSWYELIDNGRKKRLSDVEALDKQLLAVKRKYQRKNIELVVNLEARKSSTMQDLVDALDICQRYQIEKNLDYDKIN